MVVVIGVRVTPLARRNVLDVTRRSDWGREMRGEVSDALHHSTTPPLHHSTTLVCSIKKHRAASQDY